MADESSGAVIQYKRCSECWARLPLSEFWHGRPQCKECNRRRNREWARKVSRGQRPEVVARLASYYANNKDRAKVRGRRRHLRMNYGLTEAEFDALLLKQEFSCALCSEPLEAAHTHVDHDHKTGKVRGILCHSCNVGLGHFRDNVDLLREAVNYLERDRG